MSPIIEHITFEQFALDCRRLANIISKSGKPKRIVAITRGGMVPATVLAQFLDVREIHTIALSSYDDNRERHEIIEYVRPDVPDSPDTLFVDDLVESGHTHKYIKETYPNSKLAVIYSKNPDCKLDFPAALKDEETWMRFPWEFNPINV